MPSRAQAISTPIRIHSRRSRCIYIKLFPSPLLLSRLRHLIPRPVASIEHSKLHDELY